MSTAAEADERQLTNNLIATKLEEPKPPPKAETPKPYHAHPSPVVPNRQAIALHRQTYPNKPSGPTEYQYDALPPIVGTKQRSRAGRR